MIIIKKIILILILTLLVAAGCADTSPTADYNDAQYSGTQSDAPKTLRIAAGRSFWQGSATNIYLHSSTNVWESLVLFDENMEPRMQLARSVKPSADGLTWTIYLEEGVTFHDGSPFNAEIAAFNLERLYRFNPATRAFDPDFARTGEFGQIIDFSLISEYAFSITHAEPIADFAARLSLGNSAMFAMASFDDNRVIIHPYGTGPFYYVGYDSQNSILQLNKNINYRLGVPNIDTVYFYNIPDASMRLAALQTGDIDVIADVGAVMPSQSAEIQASTGLVLNQRQVSTVHYLGINNREGRMFSDVRLRNALSLSIDRDTIVDSLLLGYGSAAISVVTDLSTNWVVDAGYRFDPEEARRLVEEWSQSTSDEEHEVIILVNSALVGRWPYQDIAVMLAAQLADIGITANIEVADSATWNERMSEGDYDITIHPDTVSSGEPIYFFIRNIASDGPNNILRYGIYNPEIDNLITRAGTELNPTIRAEYYAKLQRLVREADYIIPIWYDITLYAFHERVQNFNMCVLFLPDLFVVDVR